MILADKIIELRKKEGMSQEELAEKIGVSRQSVSKWEGALSTPDMNKILALSELFGVSTDYLLKDSIESLENAPQTEETDHTSDGEPLHPVDLETANGFLSNNEKNAVQIAFGVMLCIISPAAMIVLAACGETGALPISETKGFYIGLVVLIALVAAAVAIFVTRGIQAGPFESLKQDPLDTAYGVDGMVKERRMQYGAVHTRDLTIGILLCVISCMPLFIANIVGEDDDTIGVLHGSGLVTAVCVAILLILVGIGVFMIVKTATIWTGFQVLLEEGDYTRTAKKLSKRIGGIYWSVATAAYLLISFLTGRWEMTWILWPVAGVLYGIVAQFYKSRAR